MKTFSQKFIATLGCAFFLLAGYIELVRPTRAYAAQNTFTTTTTGGSISASATNITLASVTNIIFPTQGANGSFIYVERELMQVVAAYAPPGTTTKSVSVVRGVGGTQASAHSSGQLVWIGQGDWYSNSPTDLNVQGPCTAANIYAAPRIHVLTGSFFTCDSTAHYGYAGPGATHSAVRGAITQISATYTATYYDNIIQATAGTFVLTLPAAAAFPGKVLLLTNPGSGTVTVTTATGCASMATTTACSVYSDGTAWRLF